MPITILDFVKAEVGDKDTYTAEDFARNGVDMLGGCQGCGATLGAYNAYPSRTGYWRCASCIGDSGYATVEEFASAPPVSCPACGELDNISEPAQGVFTCGECEAVWVP